MPNTSRCVFLDTSFLVSLCDSSRDTHETAKRHFQFWIETGTQMIVSAIVYAEYLARADIPPVILSTVTVAPFDAKAADLAGRIMRRRLEASLPTPEGTPRDALKDDFKIIAHACECGAGIIATDDARTFPRFASFAAKNFSEAAGLRLVLLRDGFNPGVASCGEPELDFGA